MNILEELKKKLSDIEIQNLAMEGCSPTFTVSDIMDLIDSVELAQNLPNACTDTISRQAAIDALGYCQTYLFDSRDADKKISLEDAEYAIEQLPSAQPERTCVNCGRTANNGGWYADGRTRCPIEEHYALPKDGYCHLWEKVKSWEDNYPERQEE